MRTNEERVKALHERAKEKQDKRGILLLHSLGGTVFCLVGILFVLLKTFSKFEHEIMANGYFASSLLYESAGGYVLTAVVAFAIGVILTVVLTRRKRMRDEGYKGDLK